MKRWIGIARLAFMLNFIFWIAPWHSVFAQVQHGINWSWPAVTVDTAGNTITVDGYNIYCATASTGPFTGKTNSSLITTTSYLHTGLTLGQTDYCQITAVKGSAEGGHSATGSALFQFPPATPVTPVGAAQ